MPDWVGYVRENLRLPTLLPEREMEIIEELAQQLEDAYNESLKNGATEEEARATATQHIYDWQVLANQLTRRERGKLSPLERWQQSAQDRNQGRPGRRSLYADIQQDLFYALRMLRKNLVNR